MMLYTLPITMKYPIGKKIKILREIYDLSQDQLAERAHMSKNGIGNIEKGETGTPKLPNIKSIAAALGVRWQSLEDENISLAEVVKEQQEAYGDDRSHHAKSSRPGKESGVAHPKRRAG